MVTDVLRSPKEFRRLATLLREEASVAAKMPGYAPKLIHAAEDLEKHANELEALQPNTRNTFSK